MSAQAGGMGGSGGSPHTTGAAGPPDAEEAQGATVAGGRGFWLLFGGFAPLLDLSDLDCGAPEHRPQSWLTFPDSSGRVHSWHLGIWGGGQEQGSKLKTRHSEVEEASTAPRVFTAPDLIRYTLQVYQLVASISEPTKCSPGRIVTLRLAGVLRERVAWSVVPRRRLSSASFTSRRASAMLGLIFSSDTGAGPKRRSSYARAQQQGTRVVTVW